MYQLVSDVEKIKIIFVYDNIVRKMLIKQLIILFDV